MILVSGIVARLRSSEVIMRKSLAAAAAFAALWLSPAVAEEPSDILNVSYDVSRELYADIDKHSSQNTRPRQEKTSPSISRMAAHRSRLARFWTVFRRT